MENIKYFSTDDDRHHEAGLGDRHINGALSHKIKVSVPVHRLFILQLLSAKVEKIVN